MAEARPAAPIPRLSATGLIIACVSVFVGWSCTQILQWRPVQLPFLLVLGTGAIVVAAQRAERRLLFSPFMFALAAYLVIFGLIPSYDTWTDSYMTSTEGWWKGGWYGWLGLILLYGGYRAGIGRPGALHRAARRRWSVTATAVIASVLLAIAAGVALVRIQSVGFAAYLAGYAREYDLLQVTIPVLLGLFLAVPSTLLFAGNWIVARNVRTTIIFWLLIFPVGLFLTAATGSARWRGITLLIALLAVYHLGYRKLSAKALVALLVCSTLLFVGYGAFRGARRVETVVTQDYLQRYIASPELGQFRDFVRTIEGIPEVLDYQYGRTFLSVLPGLEFQTGGALFTSTFYPDLWRTGTSLPTPLPGELYMNFGFSGILLGMPLFGAMLAWAERFFVRNRLSLWSLILYCYLLVPGALLVRGEFTTFSAFTAVGGVILILVRPWVESQSAIRSEFDYRAHSESNTRARA